MTTKPMRVAIGGRRFVIRDGRFYEAGGKAVEAAPAGVWRWVARVRRVELWDANGQCPFLRRVILGEWRGWGVYLHQWLHSDPVPHRHDHSRAMLSVGLWGRYDEDTEGGLVRWRAPWVRWFPAAHRHRVLLRSRRAWTLIVAWPATRGTGMWVDGVKLTPAQYYQRFWTTRFPC